MNTYNKFLVALVMAIVAWIRAYWQIDLGIDDATATAIIGAITTALVYLVPNKEKITIEGEESVVVIKEKQSLEQAKEQVADAKASEKK